MPSSFRRTAGRILVLTFCGSMVFFADGGVLAQPEHPRMPGVLKPSPGQEASKGETTLPKEEEAESSAMDEAATEKPGSPEDEKLSVPLARTAPEEGVVVRAERLEIQGLIPSLTVTETGRVAIRLSAKRAEAYGMKLVTGQKTPTGPWGAEIGDAGPVSIQNLDADATALGFKVKGPPLKLDQSLPSVVLYDVYLKVERLDADHVGMPQMDLQTKGKVSLASDDPVFDLERLPEVQGLKGLTDLVNGTLGRLSGEDLSKEPGSEEPGPTKPPKSTPIPEPAEPPAEPRLPDPKSPQPAEPPLLPPDDGGGEIPGMDDGGAGETVKEVVVTLKGGLGRLLSALPFVREANRYEAEITVRRGDQKADAKNLTEVLNLNITSGTKIILSAEGKEAKRAVDALADFLGEKE
ncbi:HPr family phosphocarrier protein [Melghirimyces profundicolus]|uniref:HPr family phosphocarrier protein n=1 Tax=Melghirimyces profundicolus TaxID=1242148 RepID=UPI0011B1CB26|nr:HPr family phosphocarrier protein [Melghirimyces profundicolus]